MSATKDRAHEETIAEHRDTFEGIREVVACIEPPVGAGQHEDEGGALGHVHFACQSGGELHTGAACQRCARFVNWIPSPDRSVVTIRCLWHESDRVDDLMDRASAVPTATEDMSVGEAVIEAAAAGLAFVAVVENHRFLGLMRTADLDLDLEPGTLVRERMVQTTCSVPADATLRDVVAVMKAHATDIVPVLAADTLVGIITRDTLCNAGLASAFDEP
jgi:CBS domain-containing protein